MTFLTNLLFCFCLHSTNISVQWASMLVPCVNRCIQVVFFSLFFYFDFFLLTGLITLMHSLKLFRCAKAGWLFLRSAIILSAEHRQQNYSVGTSSTPISHSLQTQFQWEIKQNLLGSFTTTHPTFCLSHLGTTNGFSSNRRLKIYAYLHQHPFSASILRILPTIKWTMNCPCFSSLIPPSLPLTTQEIQCDVHSSSITLENPGCWNNTCPVHFSSLPSITVAAMNNTYFTILLQEICNTWNRMQYAVYLHARQAQGASVASVYVTGRLGEKREQRKQVRATPDSPSTSRSNYSLSRFIRCRRWWLSSQCSWTKNVQFSNMSVCFELLLSTKVFISSSCRRTFTINDSGQKLGKLLWQFGC